MFSLRYKPSLYIEIIFRVQKVSLATNIKDQKTYTIIRNNFSPSAVLRSDVCYYCTYHSILLCELFCAVANWYAVLVLDWFQILFTSGSALTYMVKCI